MRILAFSDLHGTLHIVEQIREMETNRFDAIIIAGDIDSQRANVADKIFQILGSFGCPILYVYGNWDHHLDYSRDFGGNCHHLHLEPFTLEGMHFVGFSGVPQNWGQNPFALEFEARMKARHAPLFAELGAREEAQNANEERAKAHEAEQKARLDASTRDRRRLSYKHAVRQIEETTKALRSAARLPVEELRGSAEYAAYLSERDAAYPEILACNRAALGTSLSHIDNSKTVVVTHSRLTHTKNEFPEISLFLFGHRHGFSDTSYKGSRFINVSAADNPITVRPVGHQAVWWEDLQFMNAGSYTIIELGRLATSAVPVRFPVDFFGDWVPSFDVTLSAGSATPYVRVKA